MTTKSNVELRKFGLTMAIAFAAIGGFMLWRDKPAWMYLFAIAGFFLVFGLTLPRLLAPIEWAWMKFAYALSFVMTYVLITLIFYVAITPIGLVMRLLGKDPLALKFDKNAKSYWVPVDPNGPCSRLDTPY